MREPGLRAVWGRDVQVVDANELGDVRALLRGIGSKGFRTITGPQPAELILEVV
mgnify:CR=1 FL=1|jgi:hypothetical protein